MGKIAALRNKLVSDGPVPSEEEIANELDSWDLKSVGAGLGSGRVLPAADIVEELFLIPKIPLTRLKDLEKEWKGKSKDAEAVLEELLDLQSKELIPAGWLNQGVDDDERAEEDEEERDERDE